MSNAKTICDALSPLICFEESRQRSIRRELWVLFESPDSRRCSTNPDLYRFINSIPGDLFCTFDTLSPTDKDVVLDFIEQGNPYWYLDEHDSWEELVTFGDLVDRLQRQLDGEFEETRKIGFSPFAIIHPRDFLHICQQFRNDCPEVFTMKLPPVLEREKDKKYRAYVLGLPQLGKTEATLVLAWLYWHFCGCWTVIGAWRYCTSREDFIEDIQTWFNEGVKRMLLERNFSRDRLDLATLHVSSGRRTVSFETGQGQVDCGQVVSLISNCSPLEKLGDYLKDLDGMTFWERRCQDMKSRDGRETIPIVMLMDEVDQTISSPSVNLLKGEKALYESLADSVYHFVGITATPQANAIHHACTNSNSRKIQVIQLRIRRDYFGLLLPSPEYDGQNIRIERVAHFHDDLGRCVEPMINKSIEDISNPDPARVYRKIWLSGTEHVLAAIQLIVPDKNTVDELEDGARTLDSLVKEVIRAQPEENAKVTVLTATWHYKENLLFCHDADEGILLSVARRIGVTTSTEVEVDELQEDELEEDELERLPARRKIRITKKVHLKHIMDLFKEYMHSDPGKRYYCAVVAKNKVGRAVPIKCSDHEIHITDMFHQCTGLTKKGNEKQAMSHEQVMQALNRIAGRYKTYVDNNLGPPPLTLWTSVKVFRTLQDAVRVHKQSVDIWKDDRMPFTNEHDFFTLESPANQTRVVNKKRLNQELHINPITRPVLSSFYSDILLVTTCSIEEAADIPDESLLGLIKDNVPQIKAMQSYVDRIVVANHVVSKVCDGSDNDVENLALVLKVNRNPFSTSRNKDLAKQVFQLGEYQEQEVVPGWGFRSIIPDLTAQSVLDGLTRPPLGGLVRGGEYDFEGGVTRVLAFVTQYDGRGRNRNTNENLLVGIVSDIDQIRIQADLLADGKRGFGEGDGTNSKILAYWVPAGLQSESGKVELRLDIPKGSFRTSSQVTMLVGS